MVSAFLVFLWFIAVANCEFFDRQGRRGDDRDVPDVNDARNYRRIAGRREVATASGSVKYQARQHYEDIPLFGRAVVVERDGGGNLKPVSGRYSRRQDIADAVPSVEPSISLADATEIALDLHGQTAATVLSFTNELMIYNHNGVETLAYIARYSFNDGSTQLETFIVIDAITSAVVVSLATELSLDVMTGVGGGDGTVSPELPPTSYRGDFALSVSAFDPDLVTGILEDDDLIIYDVNFQQTYPSAGDEETCRYVNNGMGTFCVVDDNAVNHVRGVSADAFNFGQLTFEMWRAYTGQGPQPGKYLVMVNYGNNYENAWSSGLYVACGNGNTYFFPLCSYKDVMAHEMAHGFTGYYSGLIYDDQSGGMNEAFSDLAGAALNDYVDGGTDWAIGYPTQYGTALRYMDDPTRGGSLDHFEDYNDNVDVHYSSGIYNKMFFLMSTDGGGSMSVQQVFTAVALANELYWTADSTFGQGVCGIQQAITDLYANDANYQVMRAGMSAAAIGVGLDACEGGLTTPAPIPIMRSQSLRRISMNTGDFQVYLVNTPADATAVLVTITCDNGDADLYVRWDQDPEPYPSTNYDCASYSADSNEMCLVDRPVFGRHTLHVMIYAYSAFSRLTYTYQVLGAASASANAEGVVNTPVWAKPAPQPQPAGPTVVEQGMTAMQFLAFLSMALSGLVYMCKACEVCGFARKEQPSKYAAVTQASSTEEETADSSSAAGQSLYP